MPTMREDGRGNGVVASEELTSSPGTLTIREVASRSGVSEGTLRMWETRYGFPSPHRLASGHRRYSELQLEQVRAVVRARAQGLSLPGAIEHARTLSAERRPSVYAALRHTFPHLRPQLMPKPALIALSNAIEDESTARADRPVLIGCFQQERHYRAAEARWREMARTAECAVAMADFDRNRRPRGGPVEIAIPPTDPLSREWVLVCEGGDFAACLVAWERIPRNGGHEFEAIWTIERSVVRMAGRVCCELAERYSPKAVDGLAELLATPAPSSDPEVRGAVDLLTRMVLYATRGDAL